MRNARATGVFVAVACVAGCEVGETPPLSGIEAVLPDSAAIAAAATDYSTPANVDALPGLFHPPFPPGIEDLGGAVIWDSPVVSRHSWVLSSVRVGARPALLLSRPVGSTVVERGPGRSVSTPIHEVVDATPLPPLGPDERLSLLWCSDREGRQVAAYVRWDAVVRRRPEPRLAWLPDVSMGELRSIDAGEVSCRGP